MTVIQTICAEDIGSASWMEGKKLDWIHKQSIRKRLAKVTMEDYGQLKEEHEQGTFMAHWEL